MKAVVFDMDGVLVDSEIHWVKVEADFLGSFVPGWSEEDQAQIIGMSAYDVCKRLIEHYGVKMSKEEFLEKYFALANVIYGEKSSLIPGAMELVAEVKNAGLGTALASSSPRSWVSLVSDRFSWPNFFDAICSSDDVGGVGKPEPDVYLYALNQIGLKGEEAVAIEDSAKGIKAAKRAGMRCIGFRNGFNEKQDLSEADLVIDKLDYSAFQKLGKLRA